MNTFMYNAAQKSIHRQHGLTLVEIMIALTISLVLLAGVLQIFISNQQTYRVQEAAARVQESGRFAFNFMTRDIRMAGFFGCGSLVNTPNNIVDQNDDGIADSVANFTGNGLQGWEEADLPIAMTETQNLAVGTSATTVVSGTDVISITRGSGTGVRPSGPMNSITAQIFLDPATATGLFQAGDILFITDCENADAFATTTVTPQGANINIAHADNTNTDNFLSTAYGPDAEVMTMINSYYYIGTNAAGNPSLYRFTLGNLGVLTAQELVEGVQDMQILYGEDTDADRTANIYRAANAVTDMTQVVSIRITMIVQSLEDNITTSVISPYTDRKLRRTFTTTITIRNRVV